MSFESIPRPVDTVRQGMPAHLVHWAQSGVASELSASKVSAVEKMHHSEGTDNALASDAGDKKEEAAQSQQDKGLDYEIRQEIIALARLRGLKNLTLEDDLTYKLHLNPMTEMVELLEVLDELHKRVMLSLTPDELTHLANKSHRMLGLLEDTAG
jgi:hypothetical protein